MLKYYKNWKPNLVYYLPRLYDNLYCIVIYKKIIPNKAKIGMSTTLYGVATEPPSTNLFVSEVWLLK